MEQVSHDADMQPVVYGEALHPALRWPWPMAVWIGMNDIRSLDA